MTPSTTAAESTKGAVRCSNCRRIVAYKLSTTSGRLQLKCPKCSREIQIDLSLRRAKAPIFYRRARYPISIPLQ